MGLAITSTLPIISPVYSPLNFILDSSSADYIDLDIYIGDASKSAYEGELRTLRFIGNYAEIDIQGIVQPFFSSDASGLVELKRIDLKGHSYLSGTDTSLYHTNYYVYNGVDRNLALSNYTFNNVNSQFLNNFNAPINIHKNDKSVPLFFFHGIFTNTSGSIDVSTASFRITKDGVNIPAGYKTTLSTEPKIYRLDVDPSSLNALVAGLTINGTTSTYTIDPSKNTSNVGLKTINIVPVDERYTYKRVSWVDSNGCINSLNFDLVQTNVVEVSKQIYNNNGTFKQFANKSNDIYTITSNWITEAESLALKDLWYSPSVMIDGQYAIIRNKSTQIMKRRDIKLINYTCEYELAKEYKVQTN